MAVEVDNAVKVGLDVCVRVVHVFLLILFVSCKSFQQVNDSIQAEN